MLPVESHDGLTRLEIEVNSSSQPRMASFGAIYTHATWNQAGTGMRASSSHKRPANGTGSQGTKLAASHRTEPTALMVWGLGELLRYGDCDTVTVPFRHVIPGPGAIRCEEESKIAAPTTWSKWYGVRSQQLSRD